MTARERAVFATARGRGVLMTSAAAFWRRLSAYISSSACAMRSAAVAPASGQVAVPRLMPSGMSRLRVRDDELLAQPRDEARRVLARDVGQQHGELVAARAAGNVVRAQVRVQELARPLEEHVAHGVPVVRR